MTGARFPADGLSQHHSRRPHPHLPPRLLGRVETPPHFPHHVSNDPLLVPIPRVHHREEAARTHGILERDAQIAPRQASRCSIALLQLACHGLDFSPSRTPRVELPSIIHARHPGHATMDNDSDASSDRESCVSIHSCIFPGLHWFRREVTMCYLRLHRRAFEKNR